MLDPRLRQQLRDHLQLYLDDTHDADARLGRPLQPGAGAEPPGVQAQMKLLERYTGVVTP